MPEFRFIQLDVFTDRAFTGNPLAVFPEAEGLTDEQMMQIAREM
ncbi:MAG TPA: PhzF family phenazine biosynthesis protein, partial [Pyrinomonadaceae bacterium]